MKKWLTAPYPLPGSEGYSKGIVLSVLIGLFIFSFLFLFRPFGLNTSGEHSLLYHCAGYGIITFLATLLFLIIIPQTILKNYPEEKWNYLKELIFLLLMLLVIAFANYIFTIESFTGRTYSVGAFLNILTGTFVLAFFPVTFFITIDLVRNEKIFKKESHQFNIERPTISTPEKKLTFTSDYEEEDLLISKDSFLFAEAEANYVSFYYSSNDKVQRSMLRTTLKKVESTLTDYSQIIKTHRSFIVNLEQVYNFDGNAQGYTLHFNNTDKEARVSRSFTKSVKSILKH